jgi:hypothetical protein
VRFIAAVEASSNSPRPLGEGQGVRAACERAASGLPVCRSWPSIHWHRATAAKGERPRGSLSHTRKGVVLPDGHLATSEETLASLGHGYYIY